MTEERYVFNPDYDANVALQKQMANLGKIDAQGCGAIAALSRFLSTWEPLERSEYSEGDRAVGHEQIDAFRDICNAMLAEWDLADRISPLAEARQAYQEQVEADERAFERWSKRRARGQRLKASVVHLVPRPEGEDDPSGAS